MNAENIVFVCHNGLLDDGQCLCLFTISYEVTTLSVLYEKGP